jgi:outer membrane biosynthesis protein TonB
LETERLEAARQVAARQEAARQEVLRQEATRQEAARQEAIRQELARQDAAKQEATRQEAERQATARQDAARIELAQVDDARREARRRAIGRQLDEEAARREAATTSAGASSTLAPSSSSARRGRVFGRADPNAELVLYAEAWARKIHLNQTFDMVREAAKQPHKQPLVTVAIRSDGSVESVTFVLSSGVAEIDEAIRQIVQSQMPYQAFPPALAREFDVIEIRRTWHFDMAIRLY